MKKFILKTMLIILFIILVIISVVTFNGYRYYKSKIKDISLYDKIAQIQNSNSYTPLSDIPLNYKNAVIAVEDHRFEHHGAVDFIALLRAIISNIRAKDFVEGGSTITQQVAKNLYFVEGKDTINRKIAECFMAIELEKNYSKEEILELYVNIIYYGDNYYCIKDAAKGYFNKEPAELDLYESTLLAGVPNAPSIYAPTVNPDLARKRQEKVISSMVEYGYLTQEEADKIFEGH